RVGLEILIAKLTERREKLGERRMCGLFGHVLRDPSLESIELVDYGHYGTGLLLRIAPREIEVAAALITSRGMREQVDVFDTPSAFEWHRVDGDTQRLRELLCVEGFPARRESDSSFEKSPVHIVADKASAECAERAPARTPARSRPADRGRAASAGRRRSSRQTRRPTSRDRPAAASPSRASPAGPVA